jgi:hypothetical protein
MLLDNDEFQRINKFDTNWISIWQNYLTIIIVVVEKFYIPLYDTLLSFPPNFQTSDIWIGFVGDVWINESLSTTIWKLPNQIILNHIFKLWCFYLGFHSIPEPKYNRNQKDFSIHFYSGCFVIKTVHLLTLRALFIAV